MSDFRHVVDVNLNGAFNCISTVLPGMRAPTGGGRLSTFRHGLESTSRG